MRSICRPASCLTEKKVDEAEANFKRILQIDPNQTRAYMGLSRISAAKGDVDQAEQYLLQAAEMDPKDIKPRMVLFSLYARKQEYEKAEAILEEAIAANPDNYELYINKGNYFFQRRQNEKAEKAYLTAIEKDPQNIRPYMVAAGFYDAIGSKDKVMPMYQKALEAQPDDIRVLDAMARYHLKEREVEAGRGDHTQGAGGPARIISPRVLLKAELLVLKQGVRPGHGNAEPARQGRTQISPGQLFPGSGPTWAKGTPSMAKASLAKVVELNSRHIKARLLLADIYFKERDFDLAKKESQDVLKLDPQQLPGHLDAGQCLHDRERLCRS